MRFKQWFEDKEVANSKSSLDGGLHSGWKKKDKENKKTEPESGVPKLPKSELK